jgi:hypothetical protein
MPAEREIMLAPQKVTRGNTAADFPDPLHNNPIMPSDGRQQFPPFPARDEITLPLRK